MKAKLIYLLLLTFGLMNVALANGDYCENNGADPIVGQYVGAHPDGLVQSQLLVNAGGTAILSDELFIGSNEIWTGGFNATTGTLATGGNITWKNGNEDGKYDMAITILVGLPTEINKGPNKGLGAFPTSGFLRIYGKGKMLLANDCKTLKVEFNGCIYDVTDHEFVNGTDCVPLVELDMVKVPSP